MAIEIRVLGRFSVQRDGTEIPAAAFRGRLVRTLVRVLASRRGTFVSRDVLTEALWPQRPPADPDLNLNVLVTRARSALGDSSLILTGPGGYSLAETPACTVDSEAFLELVATGQPGGALALWRGEPLAEDAYADWAQEYRGRLRRAYLDALEQAAARALEAGAPAQAAAWARLAVTEEPLREAPQLLLAKALAACRDTAGALEVLGAFRARLGEELGLDPSRESLDLETRILRGEEVAPPASSAAPHPHVAPHARAAHRGGGFGALAFIGRADELGAITGAPGDIALVAGASGSGKSRLLAEAVARSGLPALAARAAPSERDEPWHLARGLIPAALLQAPQAAQAVTGLPAQALSEAMPELGPPPSASGAPLELESRRALVLEGATRLVEAAANAAAAGTAAAGTAAGCLLVIDDLQWADASSLALLDRLAARLPGVGMVLAFRPEEVSPGGAVGSFLEGLPALGRPFRRVVLAPLGRPAIEGIFADDELVACAVEDTDRSPMAVAELVRELIARGAIEAGRDGRWTATSSDARALARQAARQGQRTTIEARVARHPATRGDLLRMLALIGRPVPARLLAASAGMPGDTVLSDLAELGRTALVSAGSEGWSVAHDLIAEVVTDALPPTSAARLHELLASALRHEGADAAEVARHLAGAGDTAAAASAFAEAAAHRLRRFAHREAEQVAEAGLALEPSEAVRSSLLEVRAEARARTGDLPGARSDLRGALAGAPSGTRRAHLLTRMALLASGAEDLARAGELAELALAEAGDHPAARAEALSVAAIIDMNADRRERADQRAGEALELFRQAGNARGIADVLDGRAMATFMAGDIRSASAAFDRVALLFEDSGDLLRAGTPRSTRGHALTFLGRPAEGLADTRRALEVARSLGHSEGEAYALWHCSEALSALGEADEALETATAALAIAERIGHREWTAATQRAVGIARQAAGDLAGAAAAFAVSLEASENLSLFAGWASARLGLVFIAQGDLDAAARHVTRSLAEGPELSRYEGRLAEAELAVASGDPGAAVKVAGAQALAEAGGHVVSARRLTELLQAAPGRVGSGVVGEPESLDV